MKNLIWYGLGAIMILAAIGHFTVMREAFQAQVPNWLPFDKDFVVIASGVVELLFGLAIFFLPNYRTQTGMLLALFFIAIFPGNISQYVNRVDSFELNTDAKRLARLFFQPVLVWLALWGSGAWPILRQRWFGR